MRAAPGIAAALLLAACQPLPHPFADDRPPRGTLALPDSVGVSIAPIDGAPKATAAKLGAAMAAALQQQEIPASDRTVSLGSYVLYGRIVETPSPTGQAVVVATWRLRDRNGQPIGERDGRAEAASRDWADGSDAAVERLAAAGAEPIAHLLQGDTPKEVAGASAGGRARVMVRHVTGAPGDGGAALARSIEAVLRQRDIDLVTDPKQAADFYLDADIAVAPAKNGKQHVKIVWHVLRADGSEIGTVAEENDVPAGLLDGPWGDVAYSVALSAQDGVVALVERGAPADHT